MPEIFLQALLCLNLFAHPLCLLGIPPVNARFQAYSFLPGLGFHCSGTINVFWHFISSSSNYSLNSSNMLPHPSSLPALSPFPLVSVDDWHANSSGSPQPLFLHLGTPPPSVLHPSQEPTVPPSYLLS
eukprot:c11196_g1_i1 orf=74-457(-)